MDQDGNVWVADMGIVPGKLGQQATKFSPKGEVLLALGKTGVSGPNNDTFDAPTDMTTAPNGDVFVTDGHGQGPTNNARIKFDKTGKFLMTWGKRGMNPGEFDGLHTITTRAAGCSWAIGRTTGFRFSTRTASSSRSGSGRPSGIFIDRNDVIYVADSESNDGYGRIVPPNGYGFNPGARRGIRIGSAPGRFSSRIRFLTPRHIPTSTAFRRQATFRGSPAWPRGWP